jgi:16S rRNA (guanine527-N7)-methyltransferase
MNAESPTALVAGLSLDLNEMQRAQLASLLETLAGDDHAPTAIREPARAIEMHVLDSLAGLQIDALCGAGTIADLGSGAGFPGLAFAVALPGAEVRLVESRGRACAFLERAVDKAGVANAAVVCSRAEEWGEGALANDAVVARALAPQPVVLEFGAPLLRLGGTLIDWRGGRSQAHESAAAAAAEVLGLERVEIRHVRPFAAARERHLHVFRKTSVTPSRFPRRAGVARKRPLA